MREIISNDIYKISMKMKRLFLQFLLIVISLSLNAQRKECGRLIYGKVLCDERGVANVLVTDGKDCALTNDKGEYTLCSDEQARFVYLSIPSGYLVKSENTVPKFYQKLDYQSEKPYDFCLIKNPKNDLKHCFLVQADVQVTSEEDLHQYKDILHDMINYQKSLPQNQDFFGIDCGDIVGDTPSLYPEYIRTVSDLGLPVYRAIGNHDMTYGGRTFEYSHATFEDYFGPVYYSFNKGKAHYIILDNCFYINRDYQYIGYIDERTFSWMEKDLSYIPKGSLVFVVMHIPSSSTKKLAYNKLLQDETSNAASLFEMLKKYDSHIITGHTHFNLNVSFNDSLMEHNTAAVCGTWWCSKLCVDGTPCGYGVYQVEDNQVKWLYKSYGETEDYQFRVYPIGSSDEFPSDIISNVWNWDEKWKVEWFENGKSMGSMDSYTGYDPMAKSICSDKKIVLYDWISPVKTTHLFHARPRNFDAKIEVKVTDRFGNVYKQIVQKSNR